MAYHYLYYLFVFVVIPITTNAMTCEELLEKKEFLSTLLLKPLGHLQHLHLTDKCMEAIQKQHDLQDITIIFYYLTETLVCQLLHMKPNLLKLTLYYNSLEKFNLGCLDANIKLNYLVIEGNANLELTGESIVTENIEIFYAGYNHLKKCPIGNGWSSLKEISLIGNVNLQWNTTFHVGDFPKLKTINKLPKDKFLNSINYVEYIEEESTTFTEESTTDITTDITTDVITETAEPLPTLIPNATINTNIDKISLVVHLQYFISITLIFILFAIIGLIFYIRYKLIFNQSREETTSLNLL